METIRDAAFVHALITFAVVIFAVGIGVLLLYANFQKNLLQQQLREVTLNTVHQRELLRGNIEAQEEERKRIAQDLHDELGAVLSIIRMNLAIMERRVGDARLPAVADVGNLRHLSEVALKNMRNISHRLMPPQLEAFGLVEALRAITDQVAITGNISITLSGDIPQQRIPNVVALSVYRIVMELINNTLKHAGATSACICFDLSDESLTCRYMDNGKGISGAQDNHRGIGQKSIDTRIHALRGTFEIDKAAPGYDARIWIPLAII
ncbi:sensor histidine kinase [Rurimicrobium arvi]|uniref:histidine kinase n=1 Tax=Rurimicrobium arvi TaxID=2049916 RepID=A0ABP8N1K1_9BACT